MERENLYRGQKINSKEWVEGSLIVDYANRYFIFETSSFLDFNQYYISEYFIEVIPETVGEYTGLTDKNGEKIFEGDIVRTERIGNKRDVISQIQYVGSCFQIKFYWDLSKYASTSIVIGNVTDNPELLNQ
jgi:uncharacterized phage protein (TIGR01671 family)